MGRGKTLNAKTDERVCPISPSLVWCNLTPPALIPGHRVFFDLKGTPPWILEEKLNPPSCSGTIHAQGRK